MDEIYAVDINEVCLVRTPEPQEFNHIREVFNTPSGRKNPTHPWFLP